MSDRRTKRQKLEAMAMQAVSPHEAEIARHKLAVMHMDLVHSVRVGRKTSPKKYAQMTFEEFWYQETGHYPEWKIDE